MSMTMREAAIIINELNIAYNMGLDKKDKEKELDFWLNTFSESADYELTLRRAKQYIRTNKFKPKIADVIAYKPKEIESHEVPEEETHEWKLKNDEEYLKKWRELQSRGRRMMDEWRVEEDEY